MVGRTLGRYKLVEEIGQGGMAVVYRGLDTTLQREVAVKILHPHLSRKEANRVRFAREARVVATLHHDNIVEIYDFSGGTEGDAFIVCEYIRGRTLADFVERSAEKSPPIPVEVAVLMIAEIGKALAHAHSQGIIHRDIKPENVMIRQDGVLKLMDFGIARVQEDTGSTMTGALIGSPAYMSPEQVGGHPVDIRSDLFAAAVLLYRLVTGRLPFDAPTPAAVLRAVETVEPEAPHRLNPLVSRALDGVILRALSKDPDERQANIDVLVSDVLASIADAQLAAPREELKAYFADPDAYTARLTSSLIPRYAKAGHERRKAGDTAAAMEVWSRVLEMDPANDDVKRALESLSRGRDRRKLLRMGLAGAAAFALVGTAGAAAWNAWPPPAAIATPTPIAEVSPTATPGPTLTAPTAAVSPVASAARTPSPAKSAVTVASPAATLVAMIATPTPIPPDRALLELDILEVAKVSIGHPPGITIGDTFEARRGILVKPDDLQKILKQCDRWCRVTVTADPENKAFAGCQTLVAYAKLSDDRRFVLWNEGGTKRLAGEDLYLRGCQTLFRVDVPGLDAETYDQSTVKLDGTNTPLGAVGQTLSTTSGVHEISVKAPGFRPWKQKIEIRTKNRDDDAFVVRAILEPEP